MTEIKVWTALVKTPDNRDTAVSVHTSETEAADAIWENYVGDVFDTDDESYFPKLGDTDLDVASWVADLERHFSLDIRLDPHTVNVEV